MKKNNNRATSTERARRRAHPGRALVRWVSTRLSFAIVSIGFSICVGAGAEPVRAMEPWIEVERNDDAGTGYVLSRRSVSPRGLSAYRLITQINEDPDVVAKAAIRFLTDDEYCPVGQRRTTLGSEDGDVLGYLYLEIPFISDRDVTTRVSREEEGTTHRLSWREVANQGPPPTPGVVRIPRLRGTFEFVPYEDGGTEVLYEVEVDLGGMLPPALVRSFFPKQIKTQISGLRAVLAELSQDVPEQDHLD